MNVLTGKRPADLKAMGCDPTTLMTPDAEP